MSKSAGLQGFSIRAHFEEIDACAQFQLRGYTVSFSSIGYSHGSCLNEIGIFKSGSADVWLMGTVEDAINWILTETGKLE